MSIVVLLQSQEMLQNHVDNLLTYGSPTVIHIKEWYSINIHAFGLRPFLYQTHTGVYLMIIIFFLQYCKKLN